MPVKIPFRRNRGQTSTARREPSIIRVSEEDAILGGIPWLDERANQHMAAGRPAEAVRVYEDDIEQCRSVVAAVSGVGRVVTPSAERVLDYRVGHALGAIGMIEASRARVRAALDRSAEALRIGRGLDRDSVEAHPWYLAEGLYIYAKVRAICRTQLPEAAEAITEMARIVTSVVPADPGAFQPFADEITRTQRQIRELARRADNGEPLGVPGTPPPDGLNWREEFQLMQLERMDAPALIEALKSADAAEALLRNVDARGDAEGARRLGDLLQARGNLEEAEAAYRRASERGSLIAAYLLGLILTARGDIDAARAAFQQASESKESKLAADSRDMLDQLHDKPR